MWSVKRTIFVDGQAYIYVKLFDGNVVRHFIDGEEVEM